jgi:GrpB-like predicted nucleotidyltransferase (UPF0157 family)
MRDSMSITPTVELVRCGWLGQFDTSVIAPWLTPSAYYARVIQVVSYDSSWPKRFAALKEEYSQALARCGVEVVSIEHVGSTSVPGLAAKPVIDCDIVVRADQVTPASDVLVGLGFRPLGELGIPQRWAFTEPRRLTGTNTYVVVDGSLSLRNHLRLRDTLRASSELRDRYSGVKRRVGATAGSLTEYGRGKNAVIQEILTAAGLTEDERKVIDAAQIPTHEEVPR